MPEPALSLLSLHDPHGPVADCTACGLCLDACPTYGLWGTEADSPRGRIALFAAGSADPSGLSPAGVAHIDACVGCLACVDACPAGVAYDRILADARPLAERSGSRPARQRALRLALLETLPYPSRLRTMLPALRTARRLGRRARVPDRLRELAGIAPDAPRADDGDDPIPAFTPAGGTRRGQVGLLLGCVQRVLHADVHRATIAVLCAEGFDVHAPAQPDCCGAYDLSAGEREHGQARAQATLAAFSGLGNLDAVITAAPFCGTAMQSYGSLLGSDGAWGFAGQIRDVSAFLTEVGPVAERGPLPLRVAYHAACQLHHGQHAGDATRALLRAIPGIELIDPAPGTADGCCGAVGLYPVLEPAAATALGDGAARRLADTGAELIVSADPGCLTQLRRHLERAGRPVSVVHPIELLWRALLAAPGPPPGRRASTRR